MLPSQHARHRGDHPEPFSESLWSRIEDIYAAILAHPFIAGLTDGTLERSAFRFYVVQDAHDLREYARALSLAAARAPTEPDIAMFAQLCRGDRGRALAA